MHENRERLEHQQLGEFYLLAYYDQAVLHNTPYHTSEFGFPEIAATITRSLVARPHQFNKVFLFSPIEKVPYLQVWP
jgi:hypothetical protein